MKIRPQLLINQSFNKSIKQKCHFTQHLFNNVLRNTCYEQHALKAVAQSQPWTIFY